MNNIEILKGLEKVAQCIRAIPESKKKAILMKRFALFTTLLASELKAHDESTPKEMVTDDK